MLQTCPFNLQDVAQTQDALTPTISFSLSNDTLLTFGILQAQSTYKLNTERNSKCHSYKKNPSFQLQLPIIHGTGGGGG